jgi:hypothetical protein
MSEALASFAVLLTPKVIWAPDGIGVPVQMRFTCAYPTGMITVHLSTPSL